MDKTGLIIVGSGPAGVSAAEEFRRHNADDPVRIVTADPDMPYQRPPLSKEFLRGDADEADTELQAAEWFDERAIEVIRASRIDAIDAAGGRLSVDGSSLSYQSLVLALGAAPTPFPVPGGEKALQLRSLTDARSLRAAAANARAAVVIGAGFIGCEAAASLAMRGVATTLVAPDAVPQAKRLGDDAGKRITRLLEQFGVTYTGSVSVASVGDNAVHLDNGTTLECDLVVAATGVKPQSAPAEAAGISTSNGRILVDAGMRTSADKVYAAGDVALAHNATAGRAVAVEHWQDAMDQGQLAGAAAAGRPGQWDAVPGFWTTIGEATLKYHAWGDGFDRAKFVDRGDGFTVWYESKGQAVGVLTYNADEDYDRGEELIRQHQPIPR